MNELDAIAEEAFRKCYSANSNRTHDIRVIRAAIDKALEYALTKEPSEKMLRDAYLELSSLYHGDGGWIESEASNEQAKLTYRAMTKQLLETIKGNSSDAQSERSAPNKQEG